MLEARGWGWGQAQHRIIFVESSKAGGLTAAKGRVSASKRGIKTTTGSKPAGLVGAPPAGAPVRLQNPGAGAAEKRGSTCVLSPRTHGKRIFKKGEAETACRVCSGVVGWGGRGAWVTDTT